MLLFVATPWLDPNLEVAVLFRDRMWSCIPTIPSGRPWCCGVSGATYCLHSAGGFAQKTLEGLLYSALCIHMDVCWGHFWKSRNRGIYSTMGLRFVWAPFWGLPVCRWVQAPLFKASVPCCLVGLGSVVGYFMLPFFFLSHLKPRSSPWQARQVTWQHGHCIEYQMNFQKHVFSTYASL